MTLNDGEPDYPQFVPLTQQVRLANGDTATYLQLLPDDPQVDKCKTSNVFKTYPKEKRKTLMALALMMLCAFLNGMAAAYVTDLAPRNPLPDFIFEQIPEQRWAWQYSDLFACSLSLMNIVFAVIHKHRWVVIRRFALITAQLYLLRAICMSVTWLAVPGQYSLEHCVQKAAPDEFWFVFGRRVAKFLLTFGVVSVDAGSRLLCGDYIFSGHTLVMVVSWFTVSLYLPAKKGRVVRILFGSVAVAGMCLIIVCRMHYTVDVILAFLISASVYGIFQTLTESQNEPQLYWHMKLVLWFLPILYYFEKQVPRTRVPRKLEWPFPGPSYIRKCVKDLND